MDQFYSEYVPFLIDEKKRQNSAEAKFTYKKNELDKIEKLLYMRQAQGP